MDRAHRALGLVVAVALASARPARAQAAAEAACFPACRSGFLCHEGRCISACNPPCGAGETCTGAAQCVPTVPATPTVFLSEAAPADVPPPVADAGWARGAFYFGATSVVIDVALTTAVVMTNPQQPSTSRTLGGLSIAVFGVTVPFLALGGGSARSHPEVRGHFGLRVASWVGYALTLGGAAVLLARSHHKIMDDKPIIAVGALGALSTLGFTLDARASAMQAERLRGTSASQPIIGLTSGRAGGVVPTLGWAGTF
jgi:hypothetical protein